MCELNSEWIYCADRWISKVYWWLSEREIFNFVVFVNYANNIYPKYIGHIHYPFLLKILNISHPY